ncbi:MAG: hypothetical protein HY769_10075 [Candidatus Stahlbacteria bacterium]|nr:hypothetical protein [Candidatus Stahlbacteria bacterium]
MKKSKVSKSLLEVWEWKDLAYKEVETLPIEEAIKKRISDSLKATKIMGFTLHRKPVEKIIPSTLTTY